MVGRGKERAAILHELRAASAATVVVAGPAGIGKTRLMTEALAEIGPVRWVHPSLAAAGIPLGAFAEFVDPAVVDPLLRIRSLIDEFCSTTTGSDRKPRVVAVDDIQLLDPMSMVVLQALMAAPGVRVVLGYRTDDLPTSLVAEALGKAEVIRIDLQPLSRAAVDELAVQALGGDVDEPIRDELWRLTQGNSLYVTELLADPDALGAVSVWDAGWSVTGRLRVPATLAEVVSTRIGDLPDAIADVIDLVALAEPIPVPVITALTSAVALEGAEIAGLVIVDDGVRLAHPLYGEVRCARAPASRLRRLRALLVRELDRQQIPGMQIAGLKGVLALTADAFEGRERILVEGARAAVGMVALPLAAELAGQVRAGSHYVDAQLLLAHICSLRGDSESVERALARVRHRELTAPQRAELVLRDSYHRLWACDDLAGAEAIVGEARAAGLVSAAVIAAQMMIDAACSRPAEVLAGSHDLAHAGPVGDAARIAADWAEITALGDLGLIRRANLVAERAHAFADHSPWGTYWRMTLCDVHLRACHLAGRGPDAQRVAADIAGRVPATTPDVEGWIVGFRGVAQYSVGDYDGAARTLARSLAAFDSVSAPPEMWYPFCLNAAEVAANRGRADEVTHLLARLATHPRRGYGFRSARAAVIAAWAEALDGATSVAAAAAREAAEIARGTGQLTSEVMCLQIAVRFGDPGCAGRLAELARELPDVGRAQHTLVHARALAAGDGDLLLQVSSTHEAIGDLGAAVDAAAQAAAAYRRAGRAGSALTAVEKARELARRSGADTPTLRAVQSDDRLSDRQREIVRLATQGLTNKEIAERLVLSVRTVEGHLYRASQILGGPIRGGEKSS
ncbi:MAG: LuxR C-terminal-related transcriptional regulator [Gordonia sp. (in: high G+C Gram-positive bacteria)]